MASRRCLSDKIVESDDFYRLSAGAQALYMHLNQKADDDGFINNADASVSRINGGKTALKLLVDKRFLLKFGDIYVIKHWRISNSLKNDRLKHPNYPNIAAKIWVKANRSYTDRPQKDVKTLYEIRTGIRPESILESTGNPNGFLTEHNITEPNITEHKADGGWLEKIWNEYPEGKRGNRDNVEAAFRDNIPGDREAAQAFGNLTLWKQSDQWNKNGGQYVPYLANWLTRGIWHEAPPIPSGKDVKASCTLGAAELEAIQAVLNQPDFQEVDGYE